MRDLSCRARRSLAGIVVAAVAVLGLPGVGAGAAPAAPAGPPPAPVPVTVGYSCFVTFPGGSTFVPYSLTFGVTAPATSHRWLPFRVAVDTPPITPNPSLQSDVRDVQVEFALPAGAPLLAYRLSGGSDFGASPPTVEVDDGVLRLKASGPFPAGAVFDLPELTLLFLGSQSGAADVATGGTSVDDPSFSWTRNSLSPGDPPGTLRPFECQPPTPVTFSHTVIG
jgi:dehydratase